MSVSLVRRLGLAYLFSLALAAQTAYDRGAALLRERRIDEAIAAFEQALQRSPRSAPALRGLGVAHAYRGDNKLAEEPLRGACEIDPHDPDGCFYYGLASYNLGRYDNAIAAYRTALKSSGRAARAHTALGLAYEAASRAAEAEQQLREGVAKDDGKSLPDSDPRVEFGAFLLRQGRLGEAKAALLDARQDSPRAHFDLGRILSQEGKLDEAVARLTKAVSLDPSYTAARLLLGRVYFRLGRAADGERETALGRKLSAAKP